MQPRPNNPEELNANRLPVADLCATCIHADNCHLRQMPTSAVHECGEYDDGTREEPVALGLLASVPAEPVEDVAESTSLVGLCVNCDHRDACTLSRPVGGVWHCEEYQ